MKITFRWYGEQDAVTLENIGQIRGMTGIVISLYDVLVGEAWSKEKIMTLKKTIENLGACGIKTICYNFMPVFDWTRTELHYRLEDDSTGLRYDQTMIDTVSLENSELSLPGWNVSYPRMEMMDFIKQYQKMSHEELWKNLTYFLQRIIPIAIFSKVKMGIHPDDPPWDILGIPRIITNMKTLRSLLGIIDLLNNGMTFCTGSLDASPSDGLPKMLHELLK